MPTGKATPRSGYSAEGGLSTAIGSTAVFNVRDGTVLNAYGNHYGPGTQVGSWEFTLTDNALWSFQHVDKPSTAPVVPPPVTIAMPTGHKQPPIPGDGPAAAGGHGTGRDPRRCRRPRRVDAPADGTVTVPLETPDPEVRDGEPNVRPRRRRVLVRGGRWSRSAGTGGAATEAR